jgi:predicted metal-dependent hydrolase
MKIIEGFLKSPYFKIKIVRRRRTRRVKRKKSHSDFILHKDAAFTLARSRVEHFNSFYHFSYNKITVRNQSSRWGSCSRKGNLNFNYRIARIAPELADYIIVHELCHLGEFNHSRKFWELVEKVIPEWRVLRARLKREGRSVF